MTRGVWRRTIQDGNGNVQAGVSVTVVDQNTLLAPVNGIHDSRTGGTLKGNPFLTGVDGLAEFYADPGRYRVTVTSLQGTNTYENTVAVIEQAALVQAYTSTYSSNVYTLTPEITPAVFAPWEAGLIMNVRLPTSTSSVTGDLSVSYNNASYPVCWSGSSETRATTGELETPINAYVTLRVNEAGTKAIIISDVSGSNTNGEWTKKICGSCFGFKDDIGSITTFVNGTSFYTNFVPTISLPVTLAGDYVINPQLTTTSSTSTNSIIFGTSVFSKTATSFRFWVVGDTGTSVGDYGYSFSGRWR